MKKWIDKLYNKLTEAFNKINTALQALKTGKEDTSNKTTTLSNANNTTYPTTKAVSDAINRIPEPVYPVRSVNSKTGDIIINKGDVGLGNVDNTSDLSKPVSTATEELINQKIAGVYRVKPSVATFEDLPKTGNEVGDARNVIDTGDNYVWSDGDAGEGAFWDKFAGVVDLSNYYNKDEVDDVIEEAISDIPTEVPTLQEVTDKGNSTTNSLQIEGYDGIDLLKEGLSLLYYPENTTSQITISKDGVAKSTILMSEKSIDFGSANGGGGALKTIFSARLDGGVSYITTRFRGLDAEDEKDFVTKGQIDSFAGKVWVPDYDNQETTNRITTPNGSWTVPEGYIGWVNCFVWGYSETELDAEVIKINGKTVGRIKADAPQSATSVSASVSGLFPVKSGDVVKFNNNSTSYCYFLPGIWV